MLLVAAVALYLAWRVHDPSRAFEVTLALLVITCPCALSLAVPAALASAHGALARSGVLALRGDALERLAETTDVVFDKTGTLCDRAATLASVETHAALPRDAVLAIAAALERDSRHPLAAAFARYDDGRAVAGLRAVPGHGLEADVGGARWRLGRAAFATGAAVDDDALWLGDGATASARFVVDEGLRVDASATVEALRAQGLALHIASGDADAKVAPLAPARGIADARARQSPEDKLARVHALQRDGRVVAMVGDGINDAPVLAGADVSFAIGDGAALAHRSADFVLVGTRLAPVADAIALARRARDIVRQNLAWAIAYNVVALPLAALGLVTPWLAAVGMALSSLTVTVNALRLRRA